MTAVYDAWCGLVADHRKLIDRIAERHGLNADRLLQSSLITVSLHDVGKLIVNFQRMMRAQDEAELRQARLGNYRHEIAGLWVVKRAAEALGRCFGHHLPGQGSLEALAVAGHHKFLSDQYLFDQTHFSNPIAWEPDAFSAITSAQGLAKAMFWDQGWKLRFPTETKDPKILQHQLSNLGDDKNFPHQYLLYLKDAVAKESGKNCQEFRDLFTLIKGLLMTADWTASGAQGEDPFLDVARSIVSVESRCLPDHLRDRYEQRRSQNRDLPAYQGFKPFQNECAVADGHVLAIAPTGSGKTEAARSVGTPTDRV